MKGQGSWAAPHAKGVHPPVSPYLPSAKRVKTGLSVLLLEEVFGAGVTGRARPPQFLPFLISQSEMLPLPLPPRGLRRWLPPLQMVCPLEW